MTESRRTRSSIAGRVSLPTFALGAIGLWVLLEFSFRRGLVPVLADPLGTALGADALVLAVGFPLIAGAIAWLGLRAGVRPADWEYVVSLRSVGAGVAGYVAFIVAFGALSFVYADILGLVPSVDATAFVGLGGTPVWVLALFFVGNGIIVPIAEELAWRGVIQTALAESYGTYVAVVVTAVAFVLKHLVVDLAAPPYRVTSLVLLALLFGVLRARYGTASSTVAHLAANATSTGLLVLA